MRFPTPRVLQVSTLLLAIGLVGAMSPIAAEAQQSRQRRMKPAAQSFNRQPPARMNSRVLDRATQHNTGILIILSSQRAYLLVDGDIGIDTPISSGKRAGMTATGRYKVTEKDADHRSNIYGDFVDK